MKTIYNSFLALAMILSSTVAFAQMEAPAPSPASTVSQVVGFTKISMDYSSPAVKGRTIFGDLIPYGVTWRAGANAATKITFSTPVSIGGKNIPAGTYSIHITPMESGDWTVHFNPKGVYVYAYMKDGKIDEEALAKDDIVAIKVSPMMAEESMERLTYWISAHDNKVAKVSMGWDKARLSFDVDTQVDAKMEAMKAAFN
ncbi:DUF2911 domain-containing protein [Algoriphagus namhaensis]|uniref:DUF2911 domain-containing protein n=1 Tax=Algoriphagus namhaensis TaxID=915353 RepID=A0ABV8AQU7_9BACT